LSAPPIDTELAGRLVADQFPQWAHLPVEPVPQGGWDNRTFRLGEELALRLPSAGRYAAAVDKEHAWLPRLAPRLPLPISAPVGRGEPALGYPSPWSVLRWLPGETALARPPADLARFAADLAAFLRALQGLEATGGPAAGRHSFFRGGPLQTYDLETRAALAELEGVVDTGGAVGVWQAALRAPFGGPAVWVHGDVAPGNLLVRDGRLSAVIDFGQLAVGDPACDLAIAWTTFAGESRAAFRAGLPLDAGTWARGRAWALWKAAIVLAGAPGVNPAGRDAASRIIAEVVAEHRAGA
jgi:aminoglycoside phosphotransferase (APT) family kinase protein